MQGSARGVLDGLVLLVRAGVRVYLLGIAGRLGLRARVGVAHRMLLSGIAGGQPVMSGPYSRKARTAEDVEPGASARADSANQPGSAGLHEGRLERDPWRGEVPVRRRRASQGYANADADASGMRDQRPKAADAGQSNGSPPAERPTRLR
jgi:hypothetical protein